MTITKETIDYVAHLARIELEPNELEKISGQLKSILGFIDKLSNANINNVDPTSYILPISNVLREDSVKQSIGSNKVLENAPLACENFFIVPKVIE